MPANDPVTRGALDVLRLEGIALLQALVETLGGLGVEAQEDRRRLQDVARDLRDSFFLVAVVGDFNAGKSSLINALLGDDLLPVGITPTTGTIDLVLHADETRRKPVMREDGLREWVHPGTGAPGVALVDTPGTGSVFGEHERLALDFLHRSDLLLFVISARRALAETDRRYLDLARQYGKKIILVINQIDLLEPVEQQEVRRFVERQARDLLNLEPLIFLVSAREGQADPRQTSPRADGMLALRAHLNALMRQSPPAQQKLLAQLALAERIARNWLETMQARAEAIGVDRARVDEIQGELEQQSQGLERRLRETEVETDRIFSALRQRGHRFLEENLTLRRPVRARGRLALQQAFHDEVVGTSLQELDRTDSAFVSAMLDQSRLYWNTVVERLQHLSDLLEQKPAGPDATVYAGQRESLQEALRIAREEMQAGVSDDALETLRQTGLAGINGTLASSATAVGALLVALLGVATPGPLLGAGAAALAFPAVAIGAPLAALGGVLALRHSRRLARETRNTFDAQVQRMQDGRREAIREMTQKERNRLTGYGRQVLLPLFSRLDVLDRREQDRCEVLQGHLDAIDRLRQALGQD